MSNVQLNEAEDQWIPSSSIGGEFSVGAVRRCMDHYTNPGPHPFTITWSNEVPLKANCFIWRSLHGKIPSLVALDAKGVAIDTTTCGCCVNEPENSNHILVLCPFAAEIRKKILKWCDIEDQKFNDVKDILSFAKTWGHCPRRRSRFISICHGLIWCLWKFRNDRLFNKTFINSTGGVDYIKSLVYMWIKSRGKGGICNWEEWSKSPFSLI